jgi:membrane protein implicated in regulation of membrane protease activity
VLLVYVGALLASAGTIALQTFGADHEASAGHDAGHGDGDHDASIWLIFASVRFWTFAFLAFGLVGTLTTLLHVASPTATIIAAIASGFASGTFAATVVRRLTSKSASSHAVPIEIVGKLGRVIVPLGTAPGKVRVEVKGTIVDYVARSKESIGEGETIIVEEFDGSEAVVSRAPKELDS